MGTTGNTTTCSGTFYDSGNSTGAYGNGETSIITFCSSSGQPIYLNFTQFRLEANYDSIYIYNGSTTSDPLIGGYSGTNSPGAVVSSNASNCITVTFKSDGSVTYLGWVADVGCGTPPPPPPPASGTACNISQPFCSGTAYNFPAATNTTAEVGPDYDCLGTQPNPVWYYLQIDQSGNLDITLSNTANLDVDFACWGPFQSSASCGALTSANVVDCSYSVAATENINIPNAVSGQYYILCITNFSNQPTNFTLTTDGTSTANTNCNILCNIQAMTANPGACNPADNTHAVSGTLTVQFPPASGTLTITAGGQSIVLNPPFTNSINYSIPGINSTGGSITVNAQFSTDTSCHFTQPYTSPAPCTCSVIASNNGPVCAGSSLQLTATVTGTPTVYQWSGPGGYNGNTQNPVIGSPTVTQSGVYSVTITAGSCTATDTTEVQILDGPVLTPVVTNLLCNGYTNGSIILNATTTQPPLSYIWSVTTATGDTAANLAVGSYSVTVTSTTGCSATGSYTIIQPNPIVLSQPTITNASCSGGGSITVNAVGGSGTLQYVWSNAGTTAAISNLAAGPYTLTVTDANSCTATATYNVGAAPGSIVFNTPQITSVSCTGSADGSITVSATGGGGPITFTWGSNVNNTTGATISNLAAGTYTVIANDPTGCSAMVSYLITEPSPIVFAAPLIIDASCTSGGSISVSASGGTGAITYAWSNNQSGATISNLAPAAYQVTATDQNGCTATATHTVNPDPTAVVLGTPVTTSVSCIGGSDGTVTVAPTGGTGTYSYNWATNPQQTTPTATGLPAGPVDITVTDGNNCSSSATYIVTEPASPVTTTLGKQNVTCNTGSNGSLQAIVAGGTPPYTYLWNDSAQQITPTASNLRIGTYAVTVTDVNGCTTTASDVISEPSAIIINTSSTAVSCVGSTDGTITVSAFGGTPPYTYSAGSAGSTFTYTPDSVLQGLAIGAYTVLVKDSYDCVQSAQAVVPNAVIDNFVTATDSTSCYGSDYNDGAAHIEALTLTNGPFSFSLDNSIPQTSGDFYNVSAGQHVISATNAHGCVSTIPVLVLEPLPIVVDVDPDTVFLTLGQGQQVLATYINAPGQVTYAWSSEPGLSCSDCLNPTVSPYTNQDYVITVSMVNGNATCYGYATLHAEVTKPEPLFIPSAFSPNGDGNNDVFWIYGQSIKTVDLKVFNRWGELVYNSNNQFSGWDGSYKGQMQQPSVFTYDAHVTFLDNSTYNQHGSITLIR